MDWLSDMVTRIKNSQQRGRLEVDVFRTNLCEAVLDCLYHEGYIRGYVLQDKSIKVLLKYKYGNPVIKELKRISTPGFRSYLSAKELEKLSLQNNKIIFTSSSGIFLNSSLKSVGGEPLIKIS